jgi:hypothetical protein
MKITRKSMFTGSINTMEIEVTPEQIARWEGGELIQVAMPNLSAEHREFIKTGVTPAEWENMFGKED